MEFLRAHNILYKSEFNFQENKENNMYNNVLVDKKVYVMLKK